MGWIAQGYEGDAHVVPDTEPGHVLSASCWCGPICEVQPAGGSVVTHRDEAQRILAASPLGLTADGTLPDWMAP